MRRRRAASDGLVAVTSRRRVLAGLLPLATLAGCGFQPVYMPTANRTAGPAERDLAMVNVPLLPDRPGQVLRQALQQRLHNDSGGLHRYDLRVAFWISGEGLAVTPDNSATRLRLTGYANWVLLANGPPQVKLTEGSARALDGLNVLDQQYFALDMENDAVQQRIAERIADQITLQLAIYFRQRAAKTAAS
jgi:LPS-assembly lipoprotein